MQFKRTMNSSSTSYSSINTTNRSTNTTPRLSNSQIQNQVLPINTSTPCLNNNNNIVVDKKQQNKTNQPSNVTLVLQKPQQFNSNKTQVTIQGPNVMENGKMSITVVVNGQQTKF